MPIYHEYHIEVIDENGQRYNLPVDIHEDHHDAHGFDGNGNLKNTSAMVTIASGLLNITKDAVKGFKYLGKAVRKY